MKGEQAVDWTSKTVVITGAGRGIGLGLAQHLAQAGAAVIICDSGVELNGAPGDAELASWKMMQRQGMLEPVHFLKVAHHGSHNGTPDDDVLEAFLPNKAPDKKKRKALISTWRDTYNGIPDPPTNGKISDRCTLVSMLDKETAPYVEWTFRG